jgi:hypothetical protein
VNPFSGGFTAQQFLQANASSSGLGFTPLEDDEVGCPLDLKKALEVIVVDEGGRQLPGYTIELSLGEARYRLQSASFGAARFEGLEDGAHGLSLAGIDRDAWEVLRVEALAPEWVESSQPAGWEGPAPVDLGEFVLPVQSGMGVDKIALRCGHLPETIWRHPNNAPLVDKRQSRNVLEPGDKIYVPPRRPRVEEARPGHLYVLVRKGARARLRLRFELAFEPLQGKHYMIEIPDQPSITGVTVDGYVECDVPAETEVVHAKVQGLPRPVVLRLDTLRPIWGDVGVLQRLKNLGLPCGKPEDGVSPEGVGALKRFQRIISIEPSGAIDDRVRKSLFVLHDKGG